MAFNSLTTINSFLAYGNKLSIAVSSFTPTSITFVFNNISNVDLSCSQFDGKINDKDMRVPNTYTTGYTVNYLTPNTTYTIKAFYLKKDGNQYSKSFVVKTSVVVSTSVTPTTNGLYSIYDFINVGTTSFTLNAPCNLNFCLIGGGGSGSSPSALAPPPLAGGGGGGGLGEGGGGGRRGRWFEGG